MERWSFIKLTQLRWDEISPAFSYIILSLFRQRVRNKRHHSSFYVLYSEPRRRLDRLLRRGDRGDLRERQHRGPPGGREGPLSKLGQALHGAQRGNDRELRIAKVFKNIGCEKIG